MIKFAHPYLAVLLFPWVLLFIHEILRTRRIRGKMQSYGTERVAEYFLGRIRFRRQQWKNTLRYVGLGLLLIAATGPKMGTKVVELKRQGVDVLLVFDTSTSMDATDVRPSRITKAQYEAGKIIARLKGDRVGMVVFAGTAHLHFPLTSDYAAAKLFLNAVDTRLVQVQGTVVAEAVQLALNTFDPETKHYKTMVIFSDGEDHDGRALELAEAAAESGIIIHTVGIGTVAGAPIPINDGSEFKRDRAGRIVTSTLSETFLRELAKVGGGTYTRIDNRTGDLAGLIDDILAMEKRALKTHEFATFEDRFQFFLFPAILCFLAELLIPGGRKKMPEIRSRFA